MSEEETKFRTRKNVRRFKGDLDYIMDIFMVFSTSGDYRSQLERILCSYGESGVIYTTTEGKDLSNLMELPRGINILFPDPDDIYNFNLLIRPTQGYYKGGSFKFTIKVHCNYPHTPPTVRCCNKIYHPNIDTDGSVCLNILRLDWTPVMDLNCIISGVYDLFLNPNPNDALNQDAAEVLLENPEIFAYNVSKSLKGGRISNFVYDNVLT